MTEEQKKEFRTHFKKCYNDEFNVYAISPEDLFSYLDSISIPMQLPVKHEIAEIDAIIKDAFDEGESWGACYSGWFRPTAQRHKEEFEESKKKIKEKYGM